jgi:hypothetical protein
VSVEKWPKNPVDRFVLARLDAEGLKPSPEADRTTLIRRLSLDLIGLPPTPEEVDAFIADPAPDAYEKVVDRLLASPHYGERWGRHWLDAARYADTDGFEKDKTRHVWFYRDWVISPTLDLVSSNWPATCSRARPRTRSSRPATCETRWSTRKGASIPSNSGWRRCSTGSTRSARGFSA